MCFSDIEGSITNKSIYGFSFLVGKHRKPQSINAKLFVPIIPFGIVAYAVTLLWDNLCRNSCIRKDHSIPLRSQHFNAAYGNTVGRNMLRTFGHPVATCCDKLGVVGSNLKMVKFFIQHLWMLHDVVLVWPGSCNNVAPGHAH